MHHPCYVCYHCKHYDATTVVVPGDTRGVDWVIYATFVPVVLQEHTLNVSVPCSIVKANANTLVVPMVSQEHALRLAMGVAIDATMQRLQYAVRASDAFGTAPEIQPGSVFCMR